ncbi:hypothetical protein CB1_001932004 [Camelus ferus]|nr:hypothetical protein CB1_001932004 [Camelus ferus]
MVKCMQHMPTPPCVLETWKARFVGLTESPEGTGELKWTVFTFLKLPQVLLALFWLLRCTAASAERLWDGLEAGTPAAATEKQLAMCLQRLEKTLSSTKNRALLHMAKLEETSF